MHLVNIKVMLSNYLMMILLVLLGWTATYSVAQVDVHQFDSPAQEAQYRAMIEELRCPKCQNQNLAGSDAPIAQDLKQRTFELVKAGQTDQQIRDYMALRYGDFISYRPPVLVLALIGWLLMVRRRSRRRPKAVGLTAAEQAKLDQLLAARERDGEQQ
jgi:cytochrome c-type biogenesis protein CcmH